MEVEVEMKMEVVMQMGKRYGDGEVIEIEGTAKKVKKATMGTMPTMNHGI